MITQEQLATLIGTTVQDADGLDIGQVDCLLLDDTTGRPEWARVRSSSARSGDAFVPLREAVVFGDRLEVAFAAATVNEAPEVGFEGEEVLSVTDEQTLFAYYGVQDVRDQVNADAGTGWAEMDRAQHIRDGVSGRESTRTRLRVYRGA
ncbi:PRC-barrel domain-containing protein [Streptomyces sp. SYSU K217416]